MFVGNQLQQPEMASASAAAASVVSAVPPSSSCCINPFCSTNESSSSSAAAQQQQQRRQPDQQTQIFNAAAPSKKKRKTDTDDASADIIAKELNELSVEGREKIYEDIHGVSEVQEETPEFIRQKLQEMNDALDNNTNRFSTKQKRDYQRALFLWPGLKHDVEFKLMFLRTDEYDGVKAARRLVNYYKEKRVLFGDSRLVKNITMDDLTEDEITAMQRGFIIEIPKADHSGRPVCYINISNFDPKTMSVESAIRAFWYMDMVLFTETEAGRRRGAVAVCEAPNAADFFAALPPLQRYNYIYTECIPGRTTAMHFSYNSPDVGYWTMNHLPMHVGKHSRLRLRGHLGSDLEIEYELLRFGIQMDGLIQKDRNGDKSVFNEFVTRRKEIERVRTHNDTAEAMERGYVEYPSPSDSIIGRGRPYRDWAGNTVWNSIVDNNVDSYRFADSKFDKGLVAYNVRGDYKRSSQSRFLLELNPSLPSSSSSSSQEQQGGHAGWKIIDLDGVDAKQKASTALQNREKTLKNATAASRQGQA